MAKEKIIQINTHQLKVKASEVGSSIATGVKQTTAKATHTVTSKAKEKSKKAKSSLFDRLVSLTKKQLGFFEKLRSKSK